MGSTVPVEGRWWFKAEEDGEEEEDVGVRTSIGRGGKKLLKVSDLERLACLNEARAEELFYFC